MRKFLLISVFSLTVPVIGLEIGLRLFDPWGAHTYYQEITSLLADMQPDPYRTYSLPPGHWNFRHWSATETDDGRYTPDTHPANCDLAFIGDSVTFGYAVNDEETFINRLAQHFPTIQMHNYGVVAYNTAQAYATIQVMPPAHGYIYLLTSDDTKAILTWPQPGYPWRLDAAIQDYRRYDWTRHKAPDTTGQNIPDWFWQSIDQFITRDDVQIVSFSSYPLAQTVAQRYPIRLLAPYIHHISITDAHPNAEGHREIATQLVPIVQDLISSVCPTTPP